MKWYNKTWVIVLFLIFLFPVGLILMWNKSCKWKTPVKIIISALIGFIFICSLSNYDNTQTTSVKTTPNPTITATPSSKPTPAITPSPTPEPVAEVPATAPIEDLPDNSSSVEKSEGTTVYVTNSGKKYHRAGCQYLSSSKISISLDDAESKGYKPCSRCW